MANENEIMTDAPVKEKFSFSPVIISDLWKGFLKFWWVALALSILFCSLMFIKSKFNFRPQYTVSATFTVNTETLSLNGEGIPSYSYVYDNATATQLADTFPYILSSNILTEAICHELQIDYVPVSLSASAVSTTNMFVLTAVGSDPDMTYNVLKSAMNNYPTAAKYLVGNVRLSPITEPEYPEEPSNKFSYKTALEGFGLGFILGALWIFIYATYRKTVKTKADVLEKLKLTVLGSLPEVKFKMYREQKIDTRVLISNENVGSGFRESVRIFRNSFLHLINDDQKVIMVTSTAPGEGKSTCAANIALTLKDTAKKVLIVDGDLRNPSVGKLLDKSVIEAEEKETEDIADVNTEENTSDAGEEQGPEYLITELEDLGISYLHFNQKSIHYWKVMNVDYLKKLFDSLRDNYDYIIVDTPPCGLLSDTMVIAQACDCIIYVILQDTVRINKISRSLDVLLTVDAPVLGAVVNGARAGLAGYGDDYGYGYSNYDRYKSYARYGYGENAENEDKSEINEQ